jgi:hypothetical protein
MNIQSTNRKNESGGILIVTFFIITSIFIGLGSYLLLVRAQYVSIMRSQAWNDSLTLCEAGVEDALAQLNPGAVTTNIVVNRGANGWGSASNGFYGPIARDVQKNNSYSVVFSDVYQPVIYATGYVKMPEASSTLKRVLRVATTNVPLYNVALAARTNATMSGNSTSTDSFNSTNPNLSTNGCYISSRASTNGDVAVEYGNLDLGNHNISGSVYLGPTATMNGGASQVSGQIHTDFNSDFPNAVAPNTTGWFTALPLGGLVNIGGVSTLFTYVFNSSGDYVVPLMAGTIYINTNAHVRLLVQGGSLSGVTIAGGGNLTMYVSAASFSLNGNNALNYQGRAVNFSYIGLPSNKSISLDGNASFTGTIYAPSASMTLNGGGSSDYDQWRRQ